MAGYVHLAAFDVKCQLKSAPQISVVASDTNVKYDHTKSQAQLDNFENDTISPYGANVQTHVGGLMSGEVSLSQNVRMLQETYEMLGQGCLYIDSIKVDIHITPTIYIAREYPKTGCMYKEIMKHEQKHIKVDRAIVNKYTNIIIKGLDAAFKKAGGYAYGPMAVADIPGAQDKLQAYSKGIIKQYADMMSEERRILQQKVDSLEEYERVRKVCVGKD